MSKNYEINIYNQNTDKIIINTVVSDYVFGVLVDAARDHKGVWFHDNDKNYYSVNFNTMYMNGREI